MEYFRLEQVNVDIRSILAELAQYPEAWTEQRGRQKIAVQREAMAIPIRGLRKSKIQGRKRRDVHESRYTTLSKRFPSVIEFIRQTAANKNAKIARAKVVNLPPGKQVFPHVDRGDYYAIRDRYHLVIDSAGSLMRAGGEEVRMKTGELWWFDNKAEHEALNDTDQDRIHLIFDLESPAASRLSERVHL